MRYLEAEILGRGGHSLVVGHDPSQISAQQLCGGEVDGIERAELRRREGS